MRDREEILKDLIQFNGNLKELQAELSQYSWDTQSSIIFITNDDLINVLRRSSENIISFDEIANWVNTIECRDDIGFEDVRVQDILFELANPEIDGELTKNRLKEMISELSL